MKTGICIIENIFHLESYNIVIKALTSNICLSNNLFFLVPNSDSAKPLVGLFLGETEFGYAYFALQLLGGNLCKYFAH